MVLIWNSISSPSTSKIRVTVFIDGFPAPRSISFTVARLMPAISAKSIWEIPKTPRRSFTTSLRFIKVYYNQLLAAKINKIFVNSKKSLINHTFCCLFTCLFLYFLFFTLLFYMLCALKTLTFNKITQISPFFRFIDRFVRNSSTLSSQRLLGQEQEISL